MALALYARCSQLTINCKLVEVKTIFPEKSGDVDFVKSQGDFERSLVVQIGENFDFKGTLFEREQLSGGEGKFLRARLRAGRDQR